LGKNLRFKGNHMIRVQGNLTVLLPKMKGFQRKVFKEYLLIFVRQRDFPLKVMEKSFLQEKASNVKCVRKIRLPAL